METFGRLFMGLLVLVGVVITLGCLIEADIFSGSANSEVKVLEAKQHAKNMEAIREMATASTSATAAQIAPASVVPYVVSLGVFIVISLALYLQNRKQQEFLNHLLLKGHGQNIQISNRETAHDRLLGEGNVYSRKGN